MVSGVDPLDVAIRYRLSAQALARHLAKHVFRGSPCEPGALSPLVPARPASPPPVVEVAATGGGGAPSTLEGVRRHLAEINDLLIAAKKSGDPIDKLLAERGRALTTLGKLSGELGASEATVVASPYWKRLRAALIEALRPFPDAARAVLEVVERFEGVPS